MKPIEITVTCSTAEEARSIMRAVVEKRLAACGQTWPIDSCYRWDGEVAYDNEHVLLMKTVDTHFDAICGVIQVMHSYDLPSIVAIPLSDCGPGYLDWLLESTDTPQPELWSHSAPLAQ